VLKKHERLGGESRGVADSARPSYGEGTANSTTPAASLAEPPAAPPIAEPPVGRYRLTDAIPPPVAPLVTRPDFARVLRLSLRAFDQLRSAGRLPRPDLVLGRSPRWRVETVRDWLAQQAAGRGR
jgi:hypothetical protein